jgi:hypothetical protein
LFQFLDESRTFGAAKVLAALRHPAPFPHATLTPRRVDCASAEPQEPVVDIIFILIIVALYAGTHWLIWALSRLGGVE